MYKVKRFSAMNTIAVKEITGKLEKSGYYDYEVSPRISGEDITIGTDLDDLTIYLPNDNDFAQYEIIDFIRKMIPFASSNVKLDRDIYVQKIRGKFSKEQYIKLLKFIIDEEGYIVIYDPIN